jgi:hypothetical protein
MRRNPACGITVAFPPRKCLAEMRASVPPIYYLVGTPKGRLSKKEAELLERPWQSVRSGHIQRLRIHLTVHLESNSRPNEFALTLVGVSATSSEFQPVRALSL